MRTQLHIKSIGLWSLFKIAFTLYAVLGLVVGLFYGLLIMAAGWMNWSEVSSELSDFPGLGILGGVLGFLAIPFFAIVYGAMGSVFVTLGGLLYNLVARFTGGLTLDTTVEVGAPVAGRETVPTLEENSD